MEAPVGLLWSALDRDPNLNVVSWIELTTYGQRRGEERRTVSWHSPLEANDPCLVADLSSRVSDFRENFVVLHDVRTDQNQLVTLPCSR